MRLISTTPLLAFLAACGSNDTGPRTEPIGSVVINFVPTAPVLVGTTVQLGATALNATGGTISSATITWQTSDPLLATVSPGGLVTAVGAGMVTITAKADTKTAAALLDLRGGGTIGVAGGSLPVLNGAFTLTIPPGGVAHPVDFLIRPMPDPVANPRIVPGSVFELKPDISPFVAFATLTIRYDPSRIPAGVLEQTLQLYVLTSGGWSLLLPGSTLDPVAKTVSGSIFLTGVFAVGGAQVASVSLGGTGLEGALYPGQSAQLTANVLDDFGRPITSVPVTWTSSDSTRATVTGGTVTGVAAGTVTITAQVQGKSAMTTIVVVPRPVADWSQATTEWTTHQGNPDHTGFVAAILDPTLFSVRWTRTAFGAAGLNPVTFGPGSVFVSSASYFGVQKLAAFDIVTGQSRWIKDFGAIHGVHPPAYGNGSVFVTTSGHEDSFLYAFDPATGVERFKSPYGNQWSTYYAPVIVGQRVYMAGGYADGMYSFDATAGTQAWFYATAQFNLWTPAVRNGVVYAYTGKSGAQLEAVDAQSGALLYQIADPHFSFFTYGMNTAPVLGAQQDLLVTQSGRLVSFDLGSRTVRWEIADKFQGMVTTAAGQVYVINGDAVDVRREDTGALLWSWTPPVSEALGNTLVVTRNLLFASTQTYTFAIDLAARRQVWSYPAGGHLSLSPQGVLLIAGDHGVVTAITVR